MGLADGTPPTPPSSKKKRGASRSPESSSPPGSPATDPVLVKQISELTGTIKTLRERIEAIENKDPDAELGPLKEQMATAKQELADLRAKLNPSPSPAPPTPEGKNWAWWK